MKKTIILISIVYLFVSCAENKYFQEIVSNKKVSISIRETFNDKYLTLNIPLEFNLNLNHSEIKDVGVYWKLNNKILTDDEDYYIRETKNDKIIFGIQDKEFPNYPESIYLLNAKNKISIDDALVLIKKYNPTADLQSIKSRNDTIFIVSYKQYREDNPQFLQQMRKQPDSLFLSIGFSDGKQKTFKEKINW